MLVGAHVVVFSEDPEADRRFLGEVLGLKSVDAGGGFMIYGLPPAEMSVHEEGEQAGHEVYLLCEDVKALVERMKGAGVACTPPEDQGWGLVTRVTLPSGGELGVYQPRHARPD